MNYKEIKAMAQAWNTVQEAKFTFDIPEDIGTMERTAFHGAAAGAHKAGKSHFNFNGKKYPVTMKKDTAKAIADEVKPAVKKALAKASAPSEKGKKAVTLPKAPFKMDEGMMDKVKSAYNKVKAKIPPSDAQRRADGEKKAMDDFANIVSKAGPNRRAPKTAADAKALKAKRDAENRAAIDKAIGHNAEDYNPYASSTKKEVQKADANKKIATARNAALKVARKASEDVDEGVMDKVKSVFSKKPKKPEPAKKPQKTLRQRNTDRMAASMARAIAPSTANFDEAATHKPNNGQEMDQGLSPSAKAQLANKTPMPDDVDGPAINKKSFDAMRKSLKTAPKRSGDNDAGEKNIKPSATPVKEDMNELSNKTLGSYVKKASRDNATTNMAKGIAMASPNSDSKDSKKMGMDVGSLSKLSRKRKAGIDRAVDKMTKETVMSADKKPEKYVKPDGKVGIRMVRTDKEVVDKDK